MADIGLLSVRKERGKIVLGWTDCGVDELGGGDYECYYTVCGKEVKTFKRALKAKYKGNLLQQCVQAFGANGSSVLVEAFFEENGIVYQKQVWS